MRKREKYSHLSLSARRFQFPPAPLLYFQLHIYYFFMCLLPQAFRGIGHRANCISRSVNKYRIRYTLENMLYLQRGKRAVLLDTQGGVRPPFISKNMAQIDIKDIKAARLSILRAKDGELRRLAFNDVLTILDFVVAGIHAIMFTSNGKFKSALQLILSIPQIITFLKEVIDMINGKDKPKSEKEAVRQAIKKATDGKQHD